MGYKLTKEIINERLGSRGFRLEGDYTTVLEKTGIICPNGHTWRATPNSVIYGSGCPHCSGRLRLSYSDLLPSFVTKEIKMLTKFISAKTPALFEHMCGHQWEAVPYTVAKRTGCPKCAGKAPLSKDIINKRLEGRGVRLVRGYTASREPATFSCEKGHEWVARPDRVMDGTGCSTCYGSGFNPSKPATFYIQKLESKTNIFLKFGITNRSVGRRVQDQQRNSIFNHTILYSVTLDDGSVVADIERAVKNRIKTRVVSKNSLPDGYTETCSVFNYNDIMRIINEKIN